MGKKGGFGRGSGKYDIKAINAAVRDLITDDECDDIAENAGKALAARPDDPVARYIVWQAMDDEDSVLHIEMLEESAGMMRDIIGGGADEMSEETQSLYASMLSDLAAYLYFNDRKDEALDAARDFMKYDDEGGLPGRIVFYSSLIEKGEFTTVVQEAETDPFETSIGEYCRSIALFEIEGPSEDASDALLDAVAMDPDMIMYIVGAWTFDEIEHDDIDEDDDDEICYLEELIMNVSVLADLWAADEDRLDFISVVALAFGYMTGRIDDPGEIDMLEEGYDNLGCLEAMREARDTFHAAIASGRSQDDVDEDALSAFKDMRNRGLFSQ
jgi:hypothetical protein